jgi:hypothetical protein
MELLYDEKDTKTYIHHTGQHTNPDLAIVSSNIKDYSKRTIITDGGSGHKAVRKQN